VEDPREAAGVPDPGTGAEKAIKEALEIAREALGMEAGYVAQFQDGEQVYREVAGDSESFEVMEDEGYPLDGSYCQRLVMGEIPNVVADSAETDAVKDLAITKLGDIGAYIGVPITFSDGRVYGTLCGLSHEKRDDLSERDVLVLKAVAKLMASELERAATDDQNRKLEGRVGELEAELEEVKEALQTAETSDTGGGEFIDARWRPD
jgi:GAF domain-containing protein